MKDITKKELIMAKASALFAAKGFQSTTIQDISKAANTSEASIYEHFKNKEDLLFSIPEVAFYDMLKSLESHLLGIKGPENQFRKLIWHYLSYMEEREEFARLFMYEIWSNQNFYNKRKDKPLTDYYQILHKIISDGINEEVFRDGIDIPTCCSMILGTMNHLILSLIVLNKPFTLIDKGDSLEELFFESIKKRPRKEAELWVNFNKKGVILQAALNEFSEKGYNETTVADISSRARVTGPTVYEYFKNKEDILMCIPELAVENFLSELKDHIANTNSPDSLFKLYLWNQASSFDNYPKYYKVLLKEIRCNQNFYETKAYQLFRRYSLELINILESGVKAGIFRKEADLYRVRDMFFGTFDQILLENIIIKDHKLTVSSKIGAIYDLMIHAIHIPQ